MLTDKQQPLLLAWSSTTSHRAVRGDQRIFVLIRGQAVSFLFLEQRYRRFSPMLTDKQQPLLLAWSYTTSHRAVRGDQRIFVLIRGHAVSF